MGWVRFHRRFGAWPGLAALVLQIVLSFGHVHVGNVHFSAVASASSAIAQAVHVTSAPLQQKLPAQHHSDDDDYCAICASIFLASTSLAAHAPLLPVPPSFEHATLTFDAQAGFDVSRPIFFQSRAPPFA